MLVQSLMSVLNTQRIINSTGWISVGVCQELFYTSQGGHHSQYYKEIVYCDNQTSSPNLGGRLFVLPVFCFSLLTFDQTFAFTSYFQRSSLSARSHLQNTTPTQNSKALLKTKQQRETVSSLGSLDDLDIFRARQFILTVS